MSPREDYPDEMRRFAKEVLAKGKGPVTVVIDCVQEIVIQWTCRCGLIHSDKIRKCDHCLDPRPSVIPSIASVKSANTGEPA